MSRIPQSSIPQEWKPGQPVEALRLNLAQEAGVFELRVQDNVGLRLYRQGNQVILGRSLDRPRRTSMWVKITAYAAIPGSTNRWRYSWIEQRAVSSGRWEDVPGGLTHVTPDIGGWGYNTIEANNGATGMQGNSVNVSTLPGGFTMQPVQGNPVVRAWYEVECGEGGLRSWHFSYVNSITGTCP